MRFYILLTLLALLAGVFAEGDAAICRKANSDIVQAINNMCGWTWDLVRLRLPLSQEIPLSNPASSKPPLC
jgi:hypothetical protein